MGSSKALEELGRGIRMIVDAAGSVFFGVAVAVASETVGVWVWVAETLTARLSPDDTTTIVPNAEDASAVDDALSCEWSCAAEVCMPPMVVTAENEPPAVRLARRLDASEGASVRVSAGSCVAEPAPTATVCVTVTVATYAPASGDEEFVLGGRLEDVPLAEDEELDAKILGTPHACITESAVASLVQVTYWLVGFR